MNGLPFDPATSFGAGICGGGEWPWRFLDVGVLELHQWVHGRDLEGEIVIERGSEDIEAGPTLLRAESEGDLDAALVRFPAWEPRA